ncbi:MAG: ribosome biogenesis GTP-binding protein YihA/YsxC [Bacteroidales bacterium]|jgi:GTP-binding protein|nr:ribosome biogenesis GTP-binding protein YihA/YsxC [Bacteroidales bacterium]
MKIKTAEFVVSNTDIKKCPKADKPEFAFIGRSNVGKSSLINMLVGKKGLAKTSSQPGKTQLINHFIVNQQWYLVDLPGYGYAKASLKARSQWSKMLQEYILKRESLMTTFVLVDARLDVQKSDIEFVNFLGKSNKPLAIIFTKVDKQSQNQTNKNVESFKKVLLEYWAELPNIFISSSQTKLGKDEILDEVEKIIASFDD